MPFLLIPLLAASFAQGVLLAALTGLGAVGWAATALLLLLGARARGRPLFAVAALLGAGVAAGWSAGSLALRPPTAACHVSRHTGLAELRLLASVETDAMPLPDGSERQELRAEALLDGDRPPRPLCGLIELHRGPGQGPLVRGDRVLLQARLRSAVGSRNPGAPSARLRRLGSSVGAIVYARPHAIVRLGVAPPPPPLSRLRARVRRSLERAALEPRRRQVLAALLLGDSALDPELRQAYARAGISHLLAVSGLHLSLVAMGALGILRRGLLLVGLGASRDPSSLVAIPAASLAIGYTLLTGASPSAARACLMACAGFLGLLLRRPPDLVRSISVAALVLLAWDPLNLFRASFQLSFLAVIGIGLVFLRERPAFEAPRAARLLRWLRDLFLASLAASLLTAPICAHHFHQVSLAGAAANLVAVPLTSCLLLPFSLAAAALAAIHPALGAPALVPAGWLAALLNGFGQAIAALPGAAVPLALGWLGSLSALAAGLALLLRARARRAAAIIALLLLGAAASSALLRRAGSPLEVTFLDVGQGDSTFLRFPDGFRVLVDGGGSLSGGGADPGASQVVPFLRAAGVTRLDLVVLSHPHPDHAGGLLAVLRQLEVGELWVCWHDERDPWMAALLAAAHERGVPVRSPRLLERGGVRLRPLWPLGYGGHCADPGFAANDNSLVLHLEHGRSSALLVGDIEADAERELLRARRGALKADLLKVPHHGSNRSSTPSLLAAIRPRLAVLSCGAQNRFGFPAPAVLDRYAAAGIPLARVDENGAIEVRLFADGEMTWSPLTGVVP